MSTKTERYTAPDAPIPSETWAWKMYGAGVENIGRNNAPETEPIPSPGPDQLLVRIDAVGMCYSDVKLIKQGGQHPKLYNRNLAEDPTRLGHEAAMTVLKVGQNLQAQYQPGQRLAIQPDIYDAAGRSTAYGYTIPGGLTQYHLLGPEVLNAAGKSYVLPLKEDSSLGYAETALTEPWACVEAAYTQRRRLEPLPGGVMWFVGRPGDEREYTFSAGLDAPETIVLTDVPPAVQALVEAEADRRGVKVVEANGLIPADYANLSQKLTAGRGFDDIVLLDPRSAEAVSTAAKVTARRGTLAMIGETPLDGLVETDVGRIHYDYTAYLGHTGPDVAAAYGPERNRCDLRPGGTAVFVGAGGPMGQMHVQRAIELPDGPSLIVATDINTMRLNALEDRFAGLAEQHHTRLACFNPAEAEESLPAYIERLTEGAGADDVVVSVPVTPLMAEAATLLKPDGMLVLFAGVPNGSYAPLDLSQVYLHNAQYTGTSGSALSDQAEVISKTVAGKLSPNRSVAAIGGLEAAREGVAAMMDGRYPGKVVIFPQLQGLPLLGLDELKDHYPSVAEKLAPGEVWTAAAEQALIELFWEGAEGE